MTTTEALVRQVLQSLGGLEVRTDRESSLGGLLDEEALFGSKMISLKISELSWLLQKVKELMKRSDEHAVDSEWQALVAAAAKEVNKCQRIVAVLEGGAQDGDLTLRRLVVWLAEPQQRLRVLANCLEAASSLRGGEIINVLHLLSKHGDPLVRRAVGPLLEETSVPFFKRLARWVLDGSLDGYGGDFMIIQQQLIGNDHPSTLWRGGHTLNTIMQPRFISTELAEQVLSAGKTVAFLRECCGDSEWAAAMADRLPPELGSASTRQRLRWLQSAVVDVRSTVGSRLLDVVMRRERLPAHLAAIHRYVLLAQGDFVRTLLDLAGPELDRTAKDLSTFSLQGHVETALRSCGAATADADLLRRVQVKLNRAFDGDCGWDVFALTYSVDGPASAVLGAEVMAAYGRASRLLWSIKQVDHVVARAWHQLEGVGHSLATLRGLEREYGIDAAAVVGNVPALLRYLHARRSDMAQFVASLQAKIVYEVIEPAWATLEAALLKTTDLDDVIKAHEECLHAIMVGTFLDGGGRGSSSNNSGIGSGGGGGNKSSASLDGGSASDVHAALRAALRSVLDIQGPIRRVAGAVETAVAVQQAFLKRVRDSEASGEWNDEVYNSPPGVSAELLAEVRSGAWRVHSAFDRQVRTFHSLVPQHSQLDFRWLSAGFLQPLGEGL